MPRRRREHIRHDLKLLPPSGWLAGIDEAGRGCFAGPVVAGAVIVGNGFFDGVWCDRYGHKVNDSKQLSPEERDEVFDSLTELLLEGTAYFAHGIADVMEIAQLNILGATKLAMRRALKAAAERSEGRVLLPEACDTANLFEPDRPRPEPARLIVDGKPLKDFPYEHTAIVKGDGKSLAIGLASIIAKVTRDRMMAALDQRHPQYGFAHHKGYGTPEHIAALLAYGPCELHRELFIARVMEARSRANDPQEDFSFCEG
jgi:ribonuclease HII